MPPLALLRKAALPARELPYRCLWAFLALLALILAASLAPHDSRLSEGPPPIYPAGYSARPRDPGISGVIRVIPLAGTAFKSPASNSINAVVSPYAAPDGGAAAVKKPSSY